jgi:murein DD-endopeptidase MepM/ murein hydrolase activator NlpD
MRWYDQSLGRFIQPDTLVPNPGDPVAFDRYHYSRNSPLVYVDPSGHGYCEHSEDALGEDCDGWDSRIEIENAILEQYRNPLHGDNYVYENFGQYRDTHPYDPHKGQNRWHASVDANSVNGEDKGVDVYPVMPGKIVDVGWESSSLGNYLVVEHQVLGSKVYSVYGHLGEKQGFGIYGNVGDLVTTETPIGSVGTTFQVDPHLHFEIRYEANVNLTDQDHMLRGRDYWAFDDTWHSKFFDLGLIYGYYDNEHFRKPELPR